MPLQHVAFSKDRSADIPVSLVPPGDLDALSSLQVDLSGLIPCDFRGTIREGIAISALSTETFVFGELN